MSAALELVAYPALELLEEDFTSNLAELEEASIGILQAGAMGDGEIGALDHYLQVRQRVEEMRRRSIRWT